MTEQRRKQGQSDHEEVLKSNHQFADDDNADFTLEHEHERERDTLRPLVASPGRPNNKSLLDVSYDTSCGGGNSTSFSFDRYSSADIGIGISAIGGDLSEEAGILDDTFDSMADDGENNNSYFHQSNSPNRTNQQHAPTKLLFPEEVMYGRGPDDDEEKRHDDVVSEEDLEGIDEDDDDTVYHHDDYSYLNTSLPSAASSAVTYASTHKLRKQWADTSSSHTCNTENETSLLSASSLLHKLNGAVEAMETSLVKATSLSIADLSFCGGAASATPRSSPRRARRTPQSSPRRTCTSTVTRDSSMRGKPRDFSSRDRAGQVTPRSSPHRTMRPAAHASPCRPVRSSPMRLGGETASPVTPSRYHGTNDADVGVSGLREMEVAVRRQLERLDCYVNTATPVRRKTNGDGSNGAYWSRADPGASRRGVLGVHHDRNSNNDKARRFGNRAGQPIKARSKRMHRLLLERTLPSDNAADASIAHDNDGDASNRMLLERAAEPSLTARRRQVLTDTYAAACGGKGDSNHFHSISMISDAKSFDDLDADDLNTSVKIFSAEQIKKQQQEQLFEESIGADPNLSHLIGDCIEPIPMVVDEAEDHTNSDRTSAYGGVAMPKILNSAAVEDLCYDSDPGLVSMSRDRMLQFEESARDMSRGILGRRRRSDARYKSSPSSSMIQHTLNKTQTLLWHTLSDCTSGGSSSSSKNCAKACSPRCVTIWMDRGLKVGDYDENGLIEPIIQWRNCYQPLDLGGGTRSSKAVASMAKTSNSIDMLSVSRIIECDRLRNGMDRSKYPFAKSSCSFIIKTNDKGDFLFQASNMEERDDIVCKWKLVIARLASLAITNDGNALFREFFRSPDAWLDDHNIAV
mmetsp:Transcript_12993/g.28093  ORF Transcript_12993/g.28093 Transcript_12993/m.28093 type:complete len:860 (+) Transcript_12993:317-2896(+)|eukprot:CAMPEP_0178501298 /NCGR_PEP_ID=MMETSP0696-20121128/16866_1 /TAXON_ID=265572 /ORGANISM="Extubocellulus spinifer, Strain CCMP396" /LENGTH=859 /DNA_ID=CAMNT_0020130219 /DNA_START=283 /DNA_END=2862 /DNA_ORIENTATION=+